MLVVNHSKRIYLVVGVNPEAYWVFFFQHPLPNFCHWTYMLTTHLPAATASSIYLIAAHSLQSFQGCPTQEPIFRMLSLISTLLWSLQAPSKDILHIAGSTSPQSCICFIHTRASRSLDHNGYFIKPFGIKYKILYLLGPAPPGTWTIWDWIQLLEVLAY